jgi:hypothetical protein
VVLARKRNIEKTAAGGLRQVFIFALRIDDDDVRVEHKRAQDLELHRVGLAGTGLREDDGVVVLEREAIEENERGIVAVDAVEDAAVARKIEGNEREDARKRRGIELV